MTKVIRSNRIPAAAFQAAPTARFRIATIGLILTLSAGMICWRLFELQGMQRDKWLQYAARQYRTGAQVQGARGTIFDRNGRALAVSVEALNVAAHPRRWRGNVEDLVNLSEALNSPPSQLREQLLKDSSFLWLARGVSPRHRAMLQRLTGKGISTFSEFRRYYPQGAIAGPLLGIVGRDGAGLSGIELTQNARLAAANYRVSLRRDALGNYLAPAAWKGATNAPEFLDGRQEGNHVVLSIDAAIQAIIEREFQSGQSKAEAERVFGLVMDAKTGNILAMAQSGGLDPSQPEGLSPAMLRNVVIQDAFEPGSTFKPLIAAIALEEGVVSANEAIDCEHGRYRVGRHTIRDVHPIDTVPLREVLVQSSNICMAKLGQRLGKKRLHSALEQLGFGKQSGLELQGEGRGILRPAQRWRAIDEATISFGQGVAVTALQLVQAYAALANGGLLVTPTVFRTAVPKRQERVFASATAEQISRMITGVVEDEHGTARKARIPGVTVHGKTGTAQKARRNGRGYDPDKVIASFIGYVDGNEIGIEEQLVMLVVVDEPGVRPRWGGTVAAPVFRRSMERILSHLLTQQSSTLRTAFAETGIESIG